MKRGIKLEEFIAVRHLHFRITFVQRLNPGERCRLVSTPVNVSSAFEGGHKTHREFVEQGLTTEIQEKLAIGSVDIGFIGKAVVGNRIRKGMRKRGQQEVRTIG